MVAYSSDEEQVEALKRWWKSYGKALTIAVAIGLLLGFGWRFYHQQKLQKSEQASAVFQAMTIANAKKQIPEAKKFANAILKDYGSTAYAGMARLLLARYAVDNKQYVNAMNDLQWVMKKAEVKSMRQIARIRAARVLIAENKLPDALKVLSKVDDPTYQPVVDSVKGDIYTAQGKVVLAKQEYQKAKIGLSAVGAQASILELKITQPFRQS